MSTNGDSGLPVVPVRHVGRWFGAAGVMVLVAMLVHTIFSKIPTGQVHCVTHDGVRHCEPVTNWRFSWNVVGQYLTNHEILSGLVRTIYITVAAMVIGIFLGVVIAIMRVSPNRLLSSPAWTFTWFFRGTPVYVQLLFWFNIAAVFPSLTIGLPFLPVTFFHINVNATLTPIIAAIVGLGLNEGAYMSEIARAGLLAVEEGQIEAATALGMRRSQTLRLIILPQAMRVIIPPTGNEVISMLKTSSLASAISVPELLGNASYIYAANYQIIPLLIVASLWYLAVTTILSVGQFYLERYFNRGATRTAPLTPWQRFRQDLRGIVAKFPIKRPEVAR